MDKVSSRIFLFGGEDCMRRLIVCKACKVFDVPYAHHSPIHKKSKARVLLLELLL